MGDPGSSQESRKAVVVSLEELKKCQLPKPRPLLLRI